MRLTRQNVFERRRAACEERGGGGGRRRRRRRRTRKRNERWWSQKGLVRDTGVTRMPSASVPVTPALRRVTVLATPERSISKCNYFAAYHCLLWQVLYSFCTLLLHPPPSTTKSCFVFFFLSFFISLRPFLCFCLLIPWNSATSSCRTLSAPCSCPALLVWASRRCYPR